MKKTKQSMTNKVQNLRVFKGQPLYIVLISIILSALALFLVVFLLIKTFSSQPKTYDEYFETIDQVMEVDRQASEWSNVYQPLDQQVGTVFYENEVLGLNPQDPKSRETSIEIQRETINDVMVNNAQAKQLGGISTPSELTEYYTGNPKNQVAADRVAESIALSQGLTPDQQLSYALYIPAGAE